MLIAYFDESGDHSGADVFAVGGCVASDEAWSRFEQEWTVALADAGINYFHMSEFENRVKQFGGWDNDRRHMLLRRLDDIFLAHVGAGVGRAVSKNDYKRIVEYEPHLVVGTNLRSFPPYLFCLRSCLEWIAREWPDRPEGERLMVVCDWSPTMRGQAQDYFRTVLQPLTWGRILIELRFVPKTERVALQAADMMAYETYKHLTKERAGMKLPLAQRRPDRKSLLNLVESRKISMKYAGPATLSAMVGHEKARGRVT